MRAFRSSMMIATRMLAVTVLTTGVAQAAQPARQAAYRDGIAQAAQPDYYSIQVTTSGQAQCAKPVARRSGPWMCPSSPAVQARTYDEFRVADTPAEEGGTCNAQGCWNVYSTTESDFSTTGSYGWEDQLGTAKMYFELRLKGAQSISKPVRFQATTAVSSLVFEGERLYYSAAHPEGNGVEDGRTMSFTSPKAHPADAVAQWEPNGYKAYENTVQVGGVVHQWTWTLYDYPGSWYLWAKSVKFDRHPKSAVIYQFNDPFDLAEPPSQAGWEAS